MKLQMSLIQMKKINLKPKQLQFEELFYYKKLEAIQEKSKIPFSYMLYAYSVKRAYRGTKPKESFR